MKDKVPRLEALCEDLMEVFITEAQPAAWTAATVAASERTPNMRGDRLYDMKVATQAGALTARALDLLDRAKGLVPAGALQPHPVEDREIDKFERQARAALERIRAS